MMMYVISALFVWYARHRKRKHPDNFVTNEIPSMIASIPIWMATIELVDWLVRLDLLGEFLSGGRGNPMMSTQTELSFLIWSLSCGAVSVIVQSPPLWFLQLCGVATWLGFVHGHFWGVYFIGYAHGPERFVWFGCILLLGAHAFHEWMPKKTKFLNSINTINRAVGTLSVCEALWTLSIWRTDGWFWMLAFFAAAAASIWYGLHYGHNFLFYAGQVFLVINIYTRFFQWFWTKEDKVYFFLLLAVGFGTLAKVAQDRWKTHKPQLLTKCTADKKEP